jgi:hypothetical protein
MLARFLSLRGADRLLLATGMFWVLAVRAAMVTGRGSFPDRQRALDALARRLPPLRGVQVLRAAWAVTAAARRVPGTVCLPWALALRALLLQGGIASDVRIGVAPPRDGVLRAHAWVECEGETFSWGDAVDEYVVLRARREPS